MNYSEKKLLTEINRFREMVGLPLINEGREKLLSSASDIKAAVRDLFGTASRMSPEGVFLMKVESAADEAALKRIFADTANKVFTRQFMKNVLMKQGGDVAKMLEYKIMRASQKMQKPMSQVQSEVETIVRNKIDSPYVDDIVDYYNSSIGEVFGGRSADDVFGRKVENPIPKKQAKDSADDLVKAKQECLDWINTLNLPSKYKNIIKKKANSLNEVPASPAAWVNSMAKEALDQMEFNRKNSTSILNTIGNFIGYLFNPKSEQNVSSGLKITRMLLWGAFVVWALYKIIKLGVKMISAGDNKVREVLDLGGYKSPEREETAKKVEETTKEISDSNDDEEGMFN